MILRIVLMLRRGFWQGNSRETGLPRCGLRTDLTPISAGLAGASDYACYLHRHLGERGHNGAAMCQCQYQYQCQCQSQCQCGCQCQCQCQSQ
jgi:hypothetical protein